ncbi:MAG TPA: cytochrome c [Pirellulaceae bacterium]|nr:cytochrome c [Pirellulaceae bacterium]HMP70242.1 cytochrome c [Pirellulaceae bacterium]
MVHTETSWKENCRPNRIFRVLCNIRLSPTVLLVAVFGLLSVGCTPAPEFRFNEVELEIRRKKLLDKDEQFDDQYRADISRFLSELFGSPDEPRFPELDDEGNPQGLLSTERLQLAAGPVRSDRTGTKFGLYREHCAQCHGISGDGRGPTSAFLNPYPRDFRLGRFKFKSTTGRTPPTEEDLRRILVEGIPGTAMPSFKLLGEEQLDALVDYVKYLSMRGQVERGMIYQIDDVFADDVRLIDWPTEAANTTSPDSVSAVNSTNRENDDELEDQLNYYMDEVYYPYFVNWIEAETSISEVPAPPETLWSDDELRLAGKALYLGKANCVQCHGATGIGDGQTTNFDLWTTNWLETPGVKAVDVRTHQDFIRAGAFPARTMKPRNLRLGVFRGGNRPADIYRRIANGIDGTPMPAASTLEPDEVWALVAYVLRLKDDPLSSNHRLSTVGEKR